jgi:flavodoxin
MNILVIYDSEFSNTEQLARAIAEALGSFGSAQTASVRHTTPPLTGVDLLIAGCPTWKTRPSQPMRDFLASLPRQALAGVAVAAFDTEYRRTPWLFKLAAGRAVAGRLKRKGGRLVVPAERFFVIARQGPLEDGELERAAGWARQIGEKLRAPAK